MNFPKIAQQRKKSILAAEMLLQVIAQTYSIGDKLPPERILAQQMGISRNTLREAIAALQLMGLIEVRHSQGNFIAMLPERNLIDEKVEYILESNTDFFTVMDIRIALEPGIVWLAVERITDDELHQLEINIQTMIEALHSENTLKYIDEDIKFHLGIACSTHNDSLVQILQQQLESRRSPLWSAMKKGLDAQAIIRVRIDEHKSIYNAILDRDQNVASNIMREHLENARERFLIEVDSSVVI